jgi:hypothetical protein
VAGDVFRTVLTAQSPQRPGAPRLASADPVCTAQGN